MANVGNQQFNYDSFKTAFDANDNLKNYIKDFDSNGLTLKTSSADDLPQSKVRDPAQSVSKMAQKAVKLTK